MRHALCSPAWTNAWSPKWTNDTIWNAGAVAKDLDNAVRERCRGAKVSESSLRTLGVWPTWKWLGQIDYYLQYKLCSNYVNTAYASESNTFETWFAANVPNGTWPDFPRWTWTGLLAQAGITNAAFTHPAYPYETNVSTIWPQRSDLAQRRAVVQELVWVEACLTPEIMWTYPQLTLAQYKVRQSWSGSYSTSWADVRANCEAAAPSYTQWYDQDSWAVAIRSLSYFSTSTKYAYIWRQYSRWDAVYLATNFSCELDWYAYVATNRWAIGDTNSIGLCINEDRVNVPFDRGWGWYLNNSHDWNSDDDTFPTTAGGGHVVWQTTTKTQGLNQASLTIGETNLLAASSWPPQDPVPGKTIGEEASGYYAGRDGGGTWTPYNVLLTLDLNRIWPCLIRWDVTNGFRYLKQE